MEDFFVIKARGGDDQYQTNLRAAVQALLSQKDVAYQVVNTDDTKIMILDEAKKIMTITAWMDYFTHCYDDNDLSIDRLKKLPITEKIWRRYIKTLEARKKEAHKDCQYLERIIKKEKRKGAKLFGVHS